MTTRCGMWSCASCKLPKLDQNRPVPFGHRPAFYLCSFPARTAAARTRAAPAAPRSTTHSHRWDRSDVAGSDPSCGEVTDAVVPCGLLPDDITFDGNRVGTGLAAGVAVGPGVADGAGVGFRVLSLVKRTAVPPRGSDTCISLVCCGASPLSCTVVR